MSALCIPWAPRRVLRGRAFRLPVQSAGAQVELESGPFERLARREREGVQYYYLRAPAHSGDFALVARRGRCAARARVQVRGLDELRRPQTFNGAWWPRRWPLGKEWHSTKERQTLQDFPLSTAFDRETLAWWLAREDAELWRQLPPAELPQAHFVNVHQGCPRCGSAIFVHGGFYPWRRRHHPCDFRSQCPACGSVYPSNDLAGGDFTSGDFVDDGYGYFDAQGHIFLFAATYHRDQVCAFGRGIELLTRQLRGEDFVEETARKLGLMLLRYACEEIYLAAVPQFRYGPSEEVEKPWEWGQVDWAAQADPVAALGRKGTLRYSIDTPYISETLALAYDAIWPFLRRDRELVARARALGLEVQEPAELLALVEEMLACLLQCALDGGAASNLPRVSQGALVLLRVLDRPDAQEVMEWLYERGPDRLRVFASNNFFADGAPPESTGGYDNIHTCGLFALEHHLRRLRQARPRSYPESRFPSLVQGRRAARIARFPHEIAVLGKSLFQFGDGGAGAQQRFAEDACYTPLPAQTLRWAAAFTGDPEVAALARGERRRLGTTLCDGVGIAVLRTGEAPERAALGVAYGDAVGHQHMDLLEVQLFAFDHPFLSDLGYPQSWASIENWEAHWATHNSVWGVVPGLAAQRLAGRGRLRRTLFIEGVQILELEAERWAWDAAAQRWFRPGVRFRRLLALVETEGEGVALVDLARIRGGGEHWRVCRGLEGEFLHEQPQQQRPGTLAGVHIARGRLEALPHPDYAALAYMDQVAALGAAPTWKGSWSFCRDGRVHLDLHQLRATPPVQVLTARATATMGAPEESSYCYRAVLWRNPAPVPDTPTCVDLVFEPRLGPPTLARARPIAVARGEQSASGVELRPVRGRSLKIYWAPEAGLEQCTRFADGVELRGALALDLEGRIAAVGASSLRARGRTCTFSHPRQEGRICALDRKAARIEVEGLHRIERGARIRINPQGRGHNYRVEAAREEAPGRHCLELDIDSLLGRARVAAVRGRRLELDFHLIARTGNLHRTRLQRATGGAWAEIAAAANPDPGRTVVELERPLENLRVGEWVEAVDYVVGDRVLFEPLCRADYGG